MKQVHIGLILHAAAKRHKKTITQIAKDAGVDQSTFYYHKDLEALPYEILFKYAMAMDYYFENEIPDFTNWLKQNKLLPQNETKLTVENLIQDRDYWRDKYYVLLEEYNELIKQKLKENK